jgi:hypothetical protein
VDGKTLRAFDKATPGKSPWALTCRHHMQRDQQIPCGCNAKDRIRQSPTNKPGVRRNRNWDPAPQFGFVLTLTFVPHFKRKPPTSALRNAIGPRLDGNSHHRQDTAVATAVNDRPPVLQHRSGPRGDAQSRAG